MGGGSRVYTLNCYESLFTKHTGPIYSYTRNIGDLQDSSASPVFVHPHLGRPDQLCGTFRREGFWVKQTVSCRVPYTTSFDPALLRMFSLPPGSPFSRDNDILQ